MSTELELFNRALASTVLATLSFTWRFPWSWSDCCITASGRSSGTMPRNRPMLDMLPISSLYSRSSTLITASHSLIWVNRSPPFALWKAVTISTNCEPRNGLNELHLLSHFISVSVRHSLMDTTRRATELGDERVINSS